MKRIFIFLAFSFIGIATCVAQSKATTAPQSFRISKDVKPPLWQVEEAPHFVDANGNQAIDANEECKIVMKLKNIGMGDGANLTAKISAEGATNGITCIDHKIPTIQVGQSAIIEFPISTNINTVDGEANFTVYVNEPLGFSSEKYSLKIQTLKFVSPMIVVKDYVVSSDNGGKLETMKPFKLQVLIQNIQYGMGENVTVTLKYPANVFNLSKEDTRTFPQLAAGESKTVDYTLLVNNDYAGTTLPLQVIIKEKHGKYAQNKDISLDLNQTLVANRSIEVAAQTAPQANIADVQLRAEVDRIIPETSKKNSHRFAIIIGNEDYHSYQNGLRSEQDVPFASGDASVFSQYCEKTLGVEKNNIVLLTNATAAKINQEVDFITRLAARDPQAEIIFYYAGHGFPDENSKVPYLIPVDVNASNLNSAIPLYDLYSKLCATGAQRVTVFLDACFSGGGRDAGLVASRGIKVTPKKDVLSGNIVVFSATSSDQTALPYSEKKHGMFTYFLLKKLQDSKGECSYSELYNYLNKNVGDNSLRINRKDQTPEVNTSVQVQDSWSDWKFN